MYAPQLTMHREVVDGRPGPRAWLLDQQECPEDLALLLIGHDPDHDPSRRGIMIDYTLFVWGGNRHLAYVSSSLRRQRMQATMQPDANEDNP